MYTIAVFYIILHVSRCNSKIVINREGNEALDEALLQEVFSDDADGLGDVKFIRSDVYLRVLWCLVGSRDTGKL